MKKYLFIFLAVCLSLPCAGQLTVEECYRLAMDNYPLVRRYGLINMSEGYDLSNASKAYLPQFSLSGRATYQTDVTSVPISIPGYEIPSLSKDQYQLLAEVSQSIWDGGAARASKEAVMAQGDVDRAQFEVDMYAVRERIDNLFFGILLLDEQIRLNDLYLEDLQVSYDRIASYMANGVANQSDLDAVRVEQLGAGQNGVQLESNRRAYLNMLSAFIGEYLDEGTWLVKPEVLDEPAIRPAYDRPEMGLYDAQQRQIDAQRLSIRASNMPNLGVFLQGGYGKPGLNMFQDKFKVYAMGGVRLSWNFGNFYTRRNNLLKIESGIRQIAVQRDTFLFNNDLQQQQLDAQYRQYRKMMADDDEIIRMRSNIVRASDAKLENGIISVTDLMRDKISEQNARVNKAVHEIELLQTIYGIKNLTNNR
ncbi:MAG: TolC family protein [Rikenellaceae bacterium]|nr:TolC family protein [Rikenellaceae bacterium]